MDEEIEKIKILNKIIRNRFLEKALELYDKGNVEILLHIKEYLEKSGLKNYLNLINLENAEFLEGEINLGYAEDNLPVKASFEEFNKNALVVAPSGHGKTNLLRNIILQTYFSKSQVIIFDSKEDFVDLAKIIGAIVLDKNTKINIFQIPDFLDRNEFIQFLADLFSDSLSLLVGSRGFLIESLERIKDFKNVSLKEFLLNLVSNDDKNDYYKVIRGRLISLSKIPFFNGKSFDLDALLNSNLIIRLGDLGFIEQKLVFNYLIGLLYLRGLKQKGNFKGLIFVDDAHNLLDVNQERLPEQGLPLIHTIFSRIRDLGYGFVVANQQISSLVSAVYSNSFIKIFGPLGIDEIKKFNLPEEISTLRKGEFFVFKNGKSKKFVTYVSLKFPLPDRTVLEEETKNKLKIEEVDEYELSKLIFNKIISDYPISFSKIQLYFSNAFSYEELSKAFNLLIQNEKIKRIYIQASPFSKIEYLVPSNVDEVEVKKKILRKMVYKKLVKMRIDFIDDGEGFVIYKPKKIYIAIMKDFADLSRLAETNFYKIYDVIDSPLSEVNILSEINPYDLSRIEVSKIYNFFLNF
ncbi:MAG: DUF87 domain-containing protein [Candidatus Rehaiarchaeum fermentans]|nr:type IV secretory system conjugative DNA transfer family protein [Candidatus Rehaiarchaeum fermentans]MCW1297195.1 type IV secretory system conjugative DNA transfer family protein [Candidatus Rehaiarchaeum fermentans]MCW1302090.1 type IV secretory system conjugative DNA transfer family protein [Candidatus Rehaiarchaeum fermentans]